MIHINEVVRYTSFVAGCFVMLGIGAGYAFASYSPTLRDRLHFTQTQINMVPSIAGAGTYVGSVGFGVLMDNFGPTPTILIASLFLVSGWILMYFSSIMAIVHTPVGLGIFYLMTTFGAQGAYYAAFVGNVRNFHLKHRGTVTGILVSLYGLSALVISQLYQHVWASDPPTLFAFMACFTAGLCIMGACAIHWIEPKPLALSSNPDPLPQSPFERSLKAVNEDGSSEVEGNDTDHFPEPDLLSVEPIEPTVHHPVARYGDRRFLSLLQSPDFWLVAVLGLTAAGAGLTFITIVGSIADSWRITEISGSTYVSVLSACNCAGRLIYGFLNDRLRRWLRNVGFFIPICICMAGAHFMMAFLVSPTILMIGTILSGLSYGGYFSTVNVVINKYFGDKDYASNLGLNSIAISIAGIVFPILSGKIYDNFAEDPTPKLDGGAAPMKHCYGTMCYRYTFLMTSGLCLVGVVAAVVLIIREKADDKRKAESDETQKLIN